MKGVTGQKEEKKEKKEKDKKKEEKENCCGTGQGGNRRLYKRSSRT